MAGGSFPRSFVLAAAAVGLTARLIFGLVYWVDEPMNRDEIEYLSLARSLAAGQGYVYDPHVKNGPVEPFGRAPGYPFFLSLVGGGSPRSVDAVPASVKVAQSIVGALGVWIIAVAAFRLGGRRSAMAAAALASVHPPLVWVAGYAYSEALFWPIGLAVALLFNHTLEQPRSVLWKMAIVLGLASGVAILVRAATVLFVPISGAWLAWKRQPAILAGLAIGLALILGPWTARNVAHYGRFVLVASDGGVTFWTGNNPLATGEGDMAANPHLKFANQALRAKYADLNEEEMEPIYYRESLTWMREHPLDWAWLMARKAFYLVVPVGPSYTLHSTRYYGLSVMAVGLLLPLAVLGGWRLGSRRALLSGMWLLAAAAVATCLVFFPQERFRIPVLDPALILLASGLWRSPTDRALDATARKVA